MRNTSRWDSTQLITPGEAVGKKVSEVAFGLVDAVSGAAPQMRFRFEDGSWVSINMHDYGTPIEDYERIALDFDERRT